MGWSTTKAQTLGRGDIVTLDDDTEAVTSVSKNENGQLVVSRQGIRSVVVSPDELVEVYR